MCVQAAGNAVKRASDNLVKAAQKAAFDAQDDQAVVVKSKMVGGIAQVSGREKTCVLHNKRQDEINILFPDLQNSMFSSIRICSVWSYSNNQKLYKFQRSVTSLVTTGK